MKYLKFTLFFLSILFIITTNCKALTLKIAVLAPEGTSWAQHLKKMTKEIKKATKKKVKFKIYYGGAQGDEPDVLRKIRVGQLHGGIFTGKTLGDINGDVRVMEIPFTFYHDRTKAYNTVTKMTGFFNQGFSKNGFFNLGFFEIGLVYFVSQKKTPNLKSLKGLKIWLWEGDHLVSTLIKQMSLVSVPMSLPDVLSSLSTGMLQAAYAPPMGILALQWNTKIKYLVDFPLAYSVGAFLIDDKHWKKISLENRNKIRTIAGKYFKEISDSNAKENVEGLQTMKGMGVEFLTFPKADIEHAKGIRKDIIKILTDKLFSKKAIELLNSSIQ